MIAIAKFERPTAQREDFNEQFLEMLPKIRRQAKIAFRGRTPEVLEELIEEVVATRILRFVQLVRRGKAALAYPTPLA